MSDALLIEVFGEQNLQHFETQGVILDKRDKKLQELYEMRQRASDAFKTDISFPDLAVSISAGVLLGLGNSLFKNFFSIKAIDSQGNIKWNQGFGANKHSHDVTRTFIDHKTPQMSNIKYAGDLHRQIGPTHDVFRFKETVTLLTQSNPDYSIWGQTAQKIIGHDIGPIGMKMGEFMKSGGFNIPSNPALTLSNHLLIDFFSKRSLPVPGTTFIADRSPEMADMMLGIYDKGFNFKNTSANALSWLLIQLIIHGYSFLFKAIPKSGIMNESLSGDGIKKLYQEHWSQIKSNNFHLMMIIAHGSSFVVDSAITLGTKSFAGLFQLNYLSLISFSHHVLSYFLNGFSRYKESIDECKKIASDLQKIDNEWMNNYSKAVSRIFANNNFISIFSNDEWNRASLQLESSLKRLDMATRKENQILEELDGLDD